MTFSDRKATSAVLMENIGSILISDNSNILSAIDLVSQERINLS